MNPRLGKISYITRYAPFIIFNQISPSCNIVLFCWWTWTPNLRFVLSICMHLFEYTLDQYRFLSISFFIFSRWASIFTIQVSPHPFDASVLRHVSALVDVVYAPHNQSFPFSTICSWSQNVRSRSLDEITDVLNRNVAGSHINDNSSNKRN